MKEESNLDYKFLHIVNAVLKGIQSKKELKHMIIHHLFHRNPSFIHSTEWMVLISKAAV